MEVWDRVWKKEGGKLFCPLFRLCRDVCPGWGKGPVSLDKTPGKFHFIFGCRKTELLCGRSLSGS